jgi:hypothetical protein
LKGHISDEGHHALRSGRPPGQEPARPDDLEAHRRDHPHRCGLRVRVRPWDYCGINSVLAPKPIGSRVLRNDRKVGAEVTTIKPGDFVIGSFFAFDNTPVSLNRHPRHECVWSSLLLSRAGEV